MIHKLASRVLAASDTLQTTVSNRTINGLIITSNKVLTDLSSLQVTLDSKLHAAKTLVNAVPMGIIGSLSDIRGGFSPRLQTAITRDTDGAGTITPLGLFGLFCYQVELGCLRLRENESNIEVVLRHGDAASNTVSISAYCNDETVDHLVTLMQTTVMRGVQTDVDAVYVCVSTPLVAVNEACTVMVSSDHGSALCTLTDLVGYACTVGAVEAEGPGQVMPAYEAADGLRGKVEVEVGGTVPAGTTLLYRSLVHDSVRVSRGTIAYADSMIARLGATDPAKGRALARAGVVPTVAELRARRATMNVK